MCTKEHEEREEGVAEVLVLVLSDEGGGCEQESMRTPDPTGSNLGREEDLLALESRLLHRSAHGPHVEVRVSVVDAASTRLEPLGDGLHAARRTRQTQQVCDDEAECGQY